MMKGLFLRQKLIEKKKHLALTEHAQQLNLIRNYQQLQKLRKSNPESISFILPIVNQNQWSNKNMHSSRNLDSINIKCQRNAKKN